MITERMVNHLRTFVVSVVQLVVTRLLNETARVQSWSTLGRI